MKSYLIKRNSDYSEKNQIRKRNNKNKGFSEKIITSSSRMPASNKFEIGDMIFVAETKYGIWSMTKNKEPDIFIKEFKNIFKKIVTMSIPNENNSVSAKKLNKIAIKNKINSQVGSNLTDALKKISDKEKKTIICFGSLYNAGFILNKN